MINSFGVAAARAWQAAALGLGWHPDDFWGATPAELAGALAPPNECDPPDKDRIDVLRARFPDRRD